MDVIVENITVIVIMYLHNVWDIYMYIRISPQWIPNCRLNYKWETVIT